MKKEELAKEIAALERAEPVKELPGTFMERVPFDDENTVHFFRPVATDMILLASCMNAPYAKAVDHAEALLEFGSEHLGEIRENQVTRITPYDSGNKKFDTFLALAPEITKFLIGKAYFLKSRTTECMAINHIEFSGTETQAEAVFRNGQVRLTDVKREITPVIFLRYHKKSGQRSEKYFAVCSHEDTTDTINELPRDGGIVEIENWERDRLTLSAEKKKKGIDAVLDGETQSVSLKDALKLMDELTFKGLKAAKKVW
jgi:hypothetical protein